jgi:hypothetical protein
MRDQHSMVANLEAGAIDLATRCYCAATNPQLLLTATKVKDIGHRRVPLFKFIDT